LNPAATNPLSAKSPYSCPEEGPAPSSRFQAAHGTEESAKPAVHPEIPLSPSWALAPDADRWKDFLERWWGEPSFALRLELLRSHLSAEVVAVGELGSRRKIKQIIGISCSHGAGDDARGKALVEAAVEALAPEGECLCSQALDPGTIPFPAAYLCLHPGAATGRPLFLVTAFDSRAKVELLSPVFPFLCPLVLESAKLSAEQAANCSIDWMLQQSQRLASIGRLASGVAHDFNNLLTVIQGNVDLLKAQLSDHSDQRVHESIHQLNAAGDRAAALARQLLRFSRGETQEIERIDLNEVVVDFMRMASRLLEESIEVRLELAEGKLEIAADRGMVGQMLMNLVVNARDAMPKGGSIAIRTDLREAQEPGGRPWACLEVADDGCGIPPDQLGKIFDPFFTTKEQGKGTGLGLPNTRTLIEKNRGKILVESEVGKGTRFELRFPPAPSVPCSKPEETPESPVDGLDSEPPRRQRIEEPRESIRGETVLLVEDDSSVRKLVRRLLEMNGCLVIEAVSGREAMDRWPEIRDSVSLVVTDVIMPGGVSGWDLARSLHEDRPELGILLTSGYTEHGGDDALKTSQQVKFLQKPYEASKLRDTLYHLRHPAA